MTINSAIINASQSFTDKLSTRTYSAQMVSTSFCVLNTINLLVVVFLCSASSKHVTLDTVLVCSVLESQLAESSNHVLDHGVLAASVLAALFPKLAICQAEIENE
jgi:hypothetical protein